MRLLRRLVIGVHARRSPVQADVDTVVVVVRETACEWPLRKTPDVQVNLLKLTSSANASVDAGVVASTSRRKNGSPAA